MADIPLFPLPLVVLPGGKLPLQIFETRYIDMVRNCLREDVGFGVIMIRDGDQVLRDTEQQLPDVEHCGSYCTIVDFDQQENGLLQIMIEAQVKFSVRDQYESADRLMRAQVEFLADEDDTELPEDKHHLAEILSSLTRHESIQALNLEIDMASAKQVSGRLTELLPVANDFKQRMLEVKDPVVRLTEIEKHLRRMQDN